MKRLMDHLRGTMRKFCFYFQFNEKPLKDSSSEASRIIFFEKKSFLI